MHDVLELAAGRHGTVLEDAEELGDAAARAEALDGGEELPAGHEVQRVGLAHEAAERLQRQAAGQVDEGARGRGDRDPADDSHVVVGHQRAVDVDARAPRRRRAGLGDLDDAVPAPLLEPVEHRGRGVAQQLPVAHGLERGEEAAVEREVRVADGVDATVTPVEVPRQDPAADGGGGEADRAARPPRRCRAGARRAPRSRDRVDRRLVQAEPEQHDNRSCGAGACADDPGAGVTEQRAGVTRARRRSPRRPRRARGSRGRARRSRGRGRAGRRLPP